MDYKKIHNKIISRAKRREKKLCKSQLCLFERHHVKPKSVSGDKKWQGECVLLTPKEHYVIHQLLVKIDKKNPNLVFSLHRLAHAKGALSNGIKYHSWIKAKVSKQIGLNNKKPKKKTIKRPTIAERCEAMLFV